jgi:hypothetical protein
LVLPTILLPPEARPDRGVLFDDMTWLPGTIAADMLERWQRAPVKLPGRVAHGGDSGVDLLDAGVAVSGSESLFGIYCGQVREPSRITITVAPREEPEDPEFEAFIRFMTYQPPEETQPPPPKRAQHGRRGAACEVSRSIWQAVTQLVCLGWVFISRKCGGCAVPGHSTGAGGSARRRFVPSLHGLGV